jgi:transcriptional regulator GlxA family with amidase domain
MQQAVEVVDDLWDALIEATTWIGVQDARLAARVWDVLWRVASLESPTVAIRPPNVALDWAVRMIGTRMGEPIDIARLASDAGVSHNHLIRLFRAAFGQTVQAYIRSARAERAFHLLTQSTVPVKAVAQQVGISDLHQFNKTIRRVYGKSPTQLRSERAVDAEYRTR